MKRLLIPFVVTILLFSIVLGGCASDALKLSTEEGESVADAETTTETREETPVSSSQKDTASTTTKKPSIQEQKPVLPDDTPLERPQRKSKILNVLIIGNSCAYYFMDELYGIISAAGEDAKIYNAYYSLASGNQVDAHWDNLTVNKNNTSKNSYKLYETSAKERKQVGGKSVGLADVISYADWDVVVMNESVRPGKCDTYEAMYKNTVEDAKRIYDYIKAEHPEAALFWYQGYSYEIGWDSSDDEAEYMTTQERQNTNHENIKLASRLICQQNKIGLIPVGDAWQLARANPAFGQHLTERWLNGNHVEDHYHDGESGGQYLNACVFFESIFQKSCVGNSFTPTAGGELEHPLTSEKISQLQQMAHSAVSAVYGSDFVK